MAGRPRSDNGEEPEDQDSEGSQSCQEPDPSCGDVSASEANEGISDDQDTKELADASTPVSPAVDLSRIMPDFSKLIQPLLPKLQDMLPDFTAYLPEINVG